MLTVADRGEGGIKFTKILLSSYVNASLVYCVGGSLKNLYHFEMGGGGGGSGKC